MKQENTDQISDILSRVRQIEIKAKGLTDHIFAGEYHTTFKGRGMSFSEVREYQYGDETRNIDWNVTARYGYPYIKEFEEERELNLMLFIDISKSEIFGSQHQTKKALLTDIAAMLAFSSLRNQDKVGAIFFADEVVEYLAPQKGRKQVLRIIQKCLTLEPPVHSSSDINPALRFFLSVQKKKNVGFILSDFIVEDFELYLQRASQKHDMIGVHIYDHYDKVLPDLGLVKFRDPETGKEQWVDSGQADLRTAYEKKFMVYQNQLQQNFVRHGLDIIDVPTDKDYVLEFQKFFKKRMARR